MLPFLLQMQATLDAGLDAVANAAAPQHPAYRTVELTGAGTWEKPADMLGDVVYITGVGGGGGGGGGSQNLGSEEPYADIAGSGGSAGSGGLLIPYPLRGATSIPYSVGAGGAGGLGAGSVGTGGDAANGQDGGATRFGDLCLPGGLGGLGAAEGGAYSGADNTATPTALTASTGKIALSPSGDTWLARDDLDLIRGEPGGGAVIDGGYGGTGGPYDASFGWTQGKSGRAVGGPCEPQSSQTGEGGGSVLGLGGAAPGSQPGPGGGGAGGHPGSLTGGAGGDGVLYVTYPRVTVVSGCTTATGIRLPLVNGGFESGDLTGWSHGTYPPGVVTPADAGVPPYRGSYVCWGNVGPAESAAKWVAQTFDLLAAGVPAEGLDDGRALLAVTWAHHTHYDDSYYRSRAELIAYDAVGTQLGAIVGAWRGDRAGWTEQAESWRLPPGTRSVRIAITLDHTGSGSVAVDVAIDAVDAVVLISE